MKARTIADFQVISARAQSAEIVYLAPKPRRWTKRNRNRSVTRHARRYGNGYRWQRWEDRTTDGETKRVLVEEEIFSHDKREDAPTD